MTLRITAGKFKGQSLTSPKDIRPATSFVKEALFNICQNQIENANFLDLFAGSGAIGLEALSRGARFTTFVDKSFKSIQIIKNNIQKLKVENFSKTVLLDVLKFVKTSTDIFDIISIDPPFPIYKEDPTYINDLLNSLSNLMNPNSIIFLEEPTYSKRDPNIEKLILVNKRKYSSAYLMQYAKK